MPESGVYLGEGLPPVPVKLAVKIRKGEFVEMGELLPEFWSSTKGEEELGKETKGRKSRKVTDICSNASVPMSSSPSTTPDP